MIPLVVQWHRPVLWLHSLAWLLHWHAVEKKKCQTEVFYPESWIYEFWRGFVNLCNFKCNCIYKITMISVRKNRIRRFKIREVKPSDENIISKIQWIFDLRKNFTTPKILVHNLYNLSKILKAHFSISGRKIPDFWQFLPKILID